MTKKFLVPLGAAIAALTSNGVTASVPPSSTHDVGDGLKNSASATQSSDSPIQSVGYIKDGEAHVLMMKKVDSGQMLAYHSSHASHASHSSHRSGR